MQSSDDKQYPLTKVARRPKSGRTVSKKDFALPKPYRRQLFSEEPQRLTRLQLGLLGFAGVMVSTLVGVLALMAHESERSPDGKLIVAAARLDNVVQEGPQRVSYPPAPLIEKRERALAPGPEHGPKTAAVPVARKAGVRTRNASTPAAKVTVAQRTAAIPKKLLPPTRAAVPLPVSLP